MKRALSTFLLLLTSVAIALTLIETFLFIEDRYPPVEDQVRGINGIDYAFLEPTGRLTSPDADTRRVLLVGDSFVAGRHCAAGEENVAGQLRRLMNTGSESPVDVVNLGVEGRDAAHYVEIVEALRSGVGPGDEVVVILYDNDINLSEESCRLIERQSAEYGITMPRRCVGILAGAAQSTYEDTFLKQLNRQLLRSRSFVLIKEASYNIPVLRGLYTRTEQAMKWGVLNSDEHRWMVDTITLLRDLVEETGATFTLAYYPNVNAITAEDPRHDIWRRFIDALQQETGIETKDPFPHFVEHTPAPALTWSLTDKHPNCTAHGIMAEYLWETVLRQSGAPAP